MNILDARLFAIEFRLTGPAWALDKFIPILSIQNKIGSSGGCGPGKLGDWLVPDTVYGLSIKPACYIHDCRYYDADTRDKRFAADKELFDNAERIIRLKSRNKLMVWLRMSRLLKYYAAVRWCGGGFTT